MRGGKAFYCPIIRSQSFDGPVTIDCELYQGFPVFLTPLLDGTESPELGIPLPPGRLDSDKILAGRLWLTGLS